MISPIFLLLFSSSSVVAGVPVTINDLLVQRVFPIDTVIRMPVEFVDIDGARIDPPQVTLSRENPDCTFDQFDLTDGVIRDGVGLYHFDMTTEQAETYTYSWEGSGSGIQVTLSDQTFFVRPSIFHTA